MDVSTISQLTATQFADMIHMNAEQKSSALRPHVRIQPLQAGTFWVDTLAGVEAVEITSRNQSTVTQDIKHGKRRLRTRRFAAAILLDPKDDVETIVDPSKPYAERMASALYRNFDRLVVEAALGSVVVDQDNPTTVTAATDGVVTVDATAGLTYEKLLEVDENFVDSDVTTEAQVKYWWGFSGNEKTALMKETELTSGDFVRDFAIEGGRVAHVFGQPVIYFAGGAKKPVLPVTSGVRACLACVDNAITVGISKELTVKVSERDDLNYSKQVYCEMILGAVRNEGVMVQRINTTVA